jgi:hypothetical protein
MGAVGSRAAAWVHFAPGPLEILVQVLAGAIEDLQQLTSRRVTKAGRVLGDTRLQIPRRHCYRQRLQAESIAGSHVAVDGGSSCSNAATPHTQEHDICVLHPPCQACPGALSADLLLDSVCGCARAPRQGGGWLTVIHAGVEWAPCRMDEAGDCARGFEQGCMAMDPHTGLLCDMHICVHTPTEGNAASTSAATRQWTH